MYTVHVMYTLMGIFTRQVVPALETIVYPIYFVSLFFLMVWRSSVVVVVHPEFSIGHRHRVVYVDFGSYAFFASVFGLDASG